jgi:hypothetical protein
MRVPRELYHFEKELAERLQSLSKAQCRGLALWVLGTILANSACQSAVVEALVVYGKRHALRQRLREWLCDGKDRAKPCQTELEVEACFPTLLRWVLSMWRGQELALAIDPTLHKDRVAAPVISVVYRGCAIPVAWHILPANPPGVWLSPIVKWLALIRPAVPDSMKVIVMTDRGLWSPILWKAIQKQGWHPVMRIQNHTRFAPCGRRPAPAGSYVSPGHAWIGRGLLSSRRKQEPVTLVAVWVEGQSEPWAIVTDLPPSHEITSIYGLRAWIEVGFRALESMGWQWQRTRRSDPTRVARYWLILAVATLWTLAHGTRVEDAELLNLPPARLRYSKAIPRFYTLRPASLFRRGLLRLRCLLGRGYFWKCLWLAPAPWPRPQNNLTITLYS